jgi:hypothetical protein
MGGHCCNVGAIFHEGRVMPVVFVASSRDLGKWGGDVGLTKHIYKLGVAEESAEAAVKAMNDNAAAGFADWKLLKTEEVEGADEDALIARLSQREKMVDPGLYPKIRGERGIFKVKPENVENHFLVKHALENEQAELKAFKATPVDVGTYLITSATR